jgi:hypothetical protein
MKEFKTVMNTIDFAFNFLLVPISQFNGYISGQICIGRGLNGLQIPDVMSL